MGVTTGDKLWPGVAGVSEGGAGSCSQGVGVTGGVIGGSGDKVGDGNGVGRFWPATGVDPGGAPLNDGSTSAGTQATSHIAIGIQSNVPTRCSKRNTFNISLHLSRNQLTLKVRSL